MMGIPDLLDKLLTEGTAELTEIIRLLETEKEDEALLYDTAREVTRRVHGDLILLRGLIEFSNRCANTCLYCGIRMGTSGVKRYRMTLAEILESAQSVRESGCGTVVLQCGVDPCYTAKDIAEIVAAVKRETGLAVTLSIGTKTKKELTLLRRAGADRYLLRFETSDRDRFRTIHPNETFETRIACIQNLKAIGFQTGSGFMIGVPGADIAAIARDILYTRKLALDMIGCGPFIPTPGTPLGEASLLEDFSVYYKTMALIRIMNPYAHIPAATAFDSLRDGGRDEVLKCGANVFMPNFTPVRYKQNYALYPGKPAVDPSANIGEAVRERIEKMGKSVSADTGHALRITHEQQRRTCGEHDHG